MKEPKTIYLEPYCRDCYNHPLDYFATGEGGRQWGANDLWTPAECEDCGKEMVVPVYKILIYEETEKGG